MSNMPDELVVLVAIRGLLDNIKSILFFIALGMVFIVYKIFRM
jgi:hypothetical protein